MNNEILSKSAVSIKDMAKMCGLSYQRFSQLRRQGYMPPPLINEDTNRPYYDEELQQVCLLVRKRNTGVNGKTIMFYSPRTVTTVTGPKRRKPKAKPQSSNANAALVESVKSLGMPDVTLQQVDTAVRELYPAGSSDVSEMEIVRAVFVHLMQKNSTR